MKQIASLTIALAALIVAAPASSQDSEVQTRFYDFNDMLIDGEFQRPEGVFATERGRAQFDSLLRIRRSFLPEIKQAAEEEALQ
jgi:hypothetical protein